MEILQNFKLNGYFAVDLYHLLAQRKILKIPGAITPSVYLKEMRLTTTQRLQMLQDIEVKNMCPTSKKTESVRLSFTPRLLVFQNYKPNDRIVAKFSVKNISTAPVFLSMVCKVSSYFSVKVSSGQLLSRLAPGISITFAITFTPAQHEDYAHKVTFVTDKEDKYILPIIAMGPRPIFNFPDEITIPETPLKVEIGHHVTVQNVGPTTSGFTLNTKCPFLVHPKSAYLTPGETISLYVTFKTMRPGQSSGVMNAIFETGENFKIVLHSSTYSVNIELEKSVVRCLDTYNTMVRQHTLKIKNMSEHALTYVCLKNDCVYKDFQDKVQLARVCYEMKENESTKCRNLVEYDVLSGEEHERIYARIFYDEIQSIVADETLLFTNSHFSVSPVKGLLWPNQVTELTIIFSPKEIGDFQVVSYLDVDGILERIPLKLVGTSLPPLIHLNVETLDMNCVYINNTYNYEVVAMNKGHINGVVLYKEMCPLFGSRVTCTPSWHCLEPGDKKVFVISFYNSNQGPFFEELNFAIRDTSVLIKLYMKGEVMYPLLTFGKPCLDFGMITFYEFYFGATRGKNNFNNQVSHTHSTSSAEPSLKTDGRVPKTLDIDIINESDVHVVACVKISSDGSEVSSITLTDYAVCEKPKPALPQWPREFNLQPKKLQIDPDSRVQLQVTLIANLVRTNETTIEMELDKSDSPPLILPVMFTAMAPEVTPALPIILKACFIDYVFQKDIVFSVNDFYGYFTVTEPDEENTLKCDIKIKEGFMEPNSTICLPAAIRTSVLGKQEVIVSLNIFGLSEPVEVCRVKGCGVKPIITCTPTALQWGQVKLLHKFYKTVTLYNDSPVKVNFKACLLTYDGRWQITPTEGCVMPECEQDLLLTLYLVDAGTYQNKAIIELEKTKDILVPLFASGVGTSIVVGELRDHIVLGRHFTKLPLNCKVIMENKGTRLHSLIWNNQYKAPKSKPQNTQFFTLNPTQFKMAAAEKLELDVTGFSNKVLHAKETWYLIGSVEGNNKKELLLECEVEAEFVDPKIELSSSTIDLQYDFGPYNEFYKLTDILTIRNISKLPLFLEINVKPPFAFVQKESTYKVTSEDQMFCCCIRYNESDLNLSSRDSEKNLYESKLLIDYLTLKPVMPSRKCPLNIFEDIHKIKKAFNFTYLIEELLEDQEVMKIQIILDTTKHTTLKSTVYIDFTKIKFRDHKNKDMIKITGKINFPNIYVLSPSVDFQCILNSSIDNKIIKITNVTPLVVCYRFQWKECIISPINLPKFSPKYLDYISDISDYSSFNTKEKEGGNSQRKYSETQKTRSTDSFAAQTLYDKNHVTHERLLMKTSPLISIEQEPLCQWSNKVPKLRKPLKIMANDVFTLTPNRGILNPNETQYVQVVFKPRRNINVKAVLECNVLGGPTELINVTGQSSDLKYKLNTQRLNFKIRSFHELASEELRLLNSALLPFDYKIYLNEPVFENDLHGTIADILPSGKILEPEEEVVIKVLVRPGVIGYYKRVFLLEIGHITHLPIEVVGWGVIPQVYLTLFRPGIDKLPAVLGYQAIASLTLEFMKAINDVFQKSAVVPSNSPIMEKCFEDPDLIDDWHICSSWDGYPSVMDIDLALERVLIVNHIKLHPEIIHLSGNKQGAIPGFYTIPYVINYGAIIIGNTVQSTVEIVNYGPIPTKIHFSKGTHIPPWLHVKLCGKLLPGESAKIQVSFSPTSTDFTELEHSVETSFNIEVPCGVNIPIIVRAMCAVPYLVSNVSSIDFGTVRCGDKIISSIPLKNIGRPSCLWYVTLRLKIPGPNPITILDNSGKFEPGEGGWLKLAFKPMIEMHYEGTLIFRFHMNPNRLTIPVVGKGVIPHVRIIGPNIVFPPTLPWSKTSFIYFGLLNPCPFPIELIIAHDDLKWKEEEDLFQLLHRYYNKPSEMLVPAVKPGHGLPSEILKFFYEFKDHVKKAMDDQVAASISSTPRTTVASKKSKGSKASASTRDTTAVRNIRTEAEIINDELILMKNKQADPLKDCLHIFEEEIHDVGLEKHTKGIMIFMHGSPCEATHCQEFAYSIGKRLNLPVINIDINFVEAMCTSKCPASVMLKAALDEFYQSVSQLTDDGDGNHNLENLGDPEDEFDLIFNKIKVIATSQTFFSPRSKTADKKKKRSPSSSMASPSCTGTMFHLDLIFELLNDYLSDSKFSRGFVVDSLTSLIFKSPTLALTSMLKCKRSISNIHLVLCQMDFSKWAQRYEEAHKETEVFDESMHKIYDASEINQIIEDFENMNEEEYENADLELKTIYITYGLERRRQKYLEKNTDVHSDQKSPCSRVIFPGDSSAKGSSRIDMADTKKKIKPDSSIGGVKKNDPKAAKPTSSFMLVSSLYNEYSKNVYENLINIASNWLVKDSELGFPLCSLSGQIGSLQKRKSDAKKKSDVQLRISEVSLCDRGFPITLVMCPCLRYKEALVNMFANSPLVIEALKVDEKFDILKAPVTRQEFTVMLPKVYPKMIYEPPLKWNYLDEPPIKKCDCNHIIDSNLLRYDTQDEVCYILSNWQCICGKMSAQSSVTEVIYSNAKSVKAEPSKTDFNHIEPLENVKSIHAHTTRLVLEPGDLVRCKYSFAPRAEGSFVLKRYVEVSGWPDSREVINISGICDLPRLDSRPKKMFEHFVRRTVEDKIYQSTYLDDLKRFDFGPIFIGSNRVYKEEYAIDLKNSSLLVTETEIEYLEDMPVFQTDKSFIKLESGRKGKLKISAAPAEVGVHENVLLFCIKENPDVISINMHCTGVVPIVEILPLSKSIDYGKLLLYRREDDRFIVKNDSILPVMWRIRNIEEFKDDFIITKYTGIVAGNENEIVPVTYIACRVGVIVRKMLIVDIYDAKGRGEPLMIDALYLSAECYDVLVEIAHENFNEKFVNFGNVKVNSIVERDMFLINRGKYNIYYKFKKVKKFPEPALLRSMEVSQECGVIPASKPVCVSFECMPSTCLKLSNVPAYTCLLLDGSKDQVVVAKFPVCITIASFYITFTLFPLGELNFHVIAVGTGISREVILTNTSKCPMTYEIILPAKYRAESEGSDSAKVKGKDNKIRNPPLKCGNFMIVNEDNLVAPGGSRTFQIQFLATAAETFEETIYFIVYDTCPAEAQGVPLKLVGTGSMPSLDIWNLETTFREHLIVKRMSDYKVPQTSPHCVFVEESVTLHFFCVTVNTSSVASIDLYNDGLVACNLKMRLLYQSNTTADILTLDRSQTIIEALMHKKIGVTFSPKALEEYRAILEIKLKLLDNQENTYKICLIGEGVIPRITMLSPYLRLQKSASVQLPVTCLGSTTHKPISFKNISPLKSQITLDIEQPSYDIKPLFWLVTAKDTERMVVAGNSDQLNTQMKIVMLPEDIATINIHFNPTKKGRTQCNVKISIMNNPYECFKVFCTAEAFLEDVILLGLEMLPLELEPDGWRGAADGDVSTVSTIKSDSKKKSKTMTAEVKKNNKGKKSSTMSIRPSCEKLTLEPAVLKYLLDIGGCELCSLQRRIVTMVNHSDKVYKFHWQESEYVAIKPADGYISPGEEKDIEILFFSVQPVVLDKEVINCGLTVITDFVYTYDSSKGTAWDSRKTHTTFDHNSEMGLNYRHNVPDDQSATTNPDPLYTINLTVLFSVSVEYTKYKCTLGHEVELLDTFIYQQRKFDFKLKNTGNVAMKVSWSFEIDEEYPARIDKKIQMEKALERLAVAADVNTETTSQEKSTETKSETDRSDVTLFSNDTVRESVDTLFEVNLPFKIDPTKECLQPNESKTFLVTFSPVDAFDFKVRLRSSIDNLDPGDQNVSTRIIVRSLIPICHLDIEESDYLTSGKRKDSEFALPPHVQVLEFNVLGPGCYFKTFNVVNPTGEPYEFIFDAQLSVKGHMAAVHCDKLDGLVEAGCSVPVTFTFSPSAIGVYESQWKFFIPQHSLNVDLLVVGLVREPDVVFSPTILVLKNSLVGFTTCEVINLINNENRPLKFEFKGNSLSDDLGEAPLVMNPTEGTLKARSVTPIVLSYTPIEDGPMSFKVFCGISYMVRQLILCVNSLSHSIRSKVTYYLIGNEHELNSECYTNIHLDKTASTYERKLTFKIKNDGSTSFFFQWHYMTSPVKKFMKVTIEPMVGHIAPGLHTDCVLGFTLKTVPVRQYPLSLSISNGLEYHMYLHADIEKPKYNFSCMHYDFGKCIVNAPDSTYKKNIALTSDDENPITVDLNFSNIPEILIDYPPTAMLEKGKRILFTIFFRPKEVKEYEFKLPFWVNSLCEENIMIRGEGVPLLFDLYEGCKKSFDLGPVKLGDKSICNIAVMNHSKIPIEATFFYKDMQTESFDDDEVTSEGTSVCLSATAKQQEQGPSRVKMLHKHKENMRRGQVQNDTDTVLASFNIVPCKVLIKPHKKLRLAIIFKPVGILKNLDVQLMMKVFEFEKPLVRLSGSASGMCLYFTQESINFGRVLKRSCKIIKVLLLNKGDFGARFMWQPLKSLEFTISPMEGHIAANTNVTFTITFRPISHNPFIKIWASCNIENYKSLELAMYATCVDIGTIEKKTLYFECPVRDVKTEHIAVTNPSDDLWIILSELTGPAFETLKEFKVEPNSTYNIPILFKPNLIGKHEGEVMFLPLAESALYVSLVGAAIHPSPNDTFNLSVSTKEPFTQDLLVHNLTEDPESYSVSTEVVKIIPDKFESHYEFKCPEVVRVWGEAAATCRWTFVCYGECEMQLKVMFVNEKSHEYQFYNIYATVTASGIEDTVHLKVRARESVQHQLIIKNPLSKDEDFTVSCQQVTCPDIIHVSRNSKASLIITYSPLVVGVTEDFVMVYHPLVGYYQYKLILECLPANEKHLQFTTSFGTSLPIRLRVQNRADTKASFITTTSHASIIVDKEYNMEPLEKGKFAVIFEPITLGKQMCRLSFNSAIAGEFVFNIEGVATDPKPQGPIEVKLGGSAMLKFKNIFPEMTTFRMHIDRDEFQLKTPVIETVKPKNEVKVIIYLRELNIQESDPMPTASLIIKNCEPGSPSAEWTYFLHGIR